MSESQISREAASEAVRQVQELRGYLDAIAEALGQPKEPARVCSVTGRLWLECDCGHCERGADTDIERSAYQPDQLAGMVRELREENKRLNGCVAALEAEMNPEDVGRAYREAARNSADMEPK